MKCLPVCAIMAFLLLNGVSAEYDAPVLVSQVHWAIDEAEKYESKLNAEPQTLAIEGMTGLKYRHLLNNLASLPGVNYLEVGCWKGSTLIAALYGNAASINQAIAIDNFSEFQHGDIRSMLFANIDQFAKECNLNFYDEDCFSIDKAKVFNESIDIYFYDGNHSFESQKKAFTYFNDIFSDVFIAIVDDYDAGETSDYVRDGIRSATLKVFYELGYEILYMRELGNSTDKYPGDSLNWWNGMLVAVLRKPSK